MELTRVPRTSATDAVFEQLMESIVSGDAVVGQELPSERAMAESLGVSRPVVREALQRLAASGLVEIHHGEATTVSDWAHTAGPDLLPRLLLGPRGIALDVARDVVEARAEFGPPVAARAARHADAAAHDRLDDLVTRMGKIPSEDLATLQWLSLTFWEQVVDASGSIVHRLLFNALASAYRPVMDALTVVMADEISDVRAYRTIERAIRDQSPDRAERATRRLVGRGTDRALAAIDVLANHAKGTS